MSNRMRFGVSGLISVTLALIGYMLPFSFLLYFFAPGFWIGDALSDSLINSLGGYLFPVFVSTLFWTFLIFGVWLLLARSRSRR